jgi:hypothetical protein
MHRALHELKPRAVILLGEAAGTCDIRLETTAWNELDFRIPDIAVHQYRSRKADDLERFIKELARDYCLPIWLTEFNGWSGPEDEHLEFLGKTLKFLEKSDDVQRYAHLDPRPGKPHSFYDAEGKPTRLDELYQVAGG